MTRNPINAVRARTAIPAWMAGLLGLPSKAKPQAEPKPGPAPQAAKAAPPRAAAPRPQPQPQQPPKPAPAPKPDAAVIRAAVADALAAERTRWVAILQAGIDLGVPRHAVGLVASGKPLTVAEARRELRAEADRQAGPKPSPAEVLVAAAVRADAIARGELVPEPTGPHAALVYEILAAGAKARGESQT